MNSSPTVDHLADNIKKNKSKYYQNFLKKD